MGDKNHIRTLGDYSKPSHEGYQNTIELPVGYNVVPLRSDTIRLVQNGCSFHGLWSEDPNQHLKDFLKLVESLDLDIASKERTRRDHSLRYLDEPPRLNSSTSHESWDGRKSAKDNGMSSNSIVKPDGSNAVVPLKEVEKENKAENGTKDEPVESAEKKLI
ncbi:hypothetical protein Tco_0922286 [Tanacetum coccineum]|uniref:Zinc finger, CCHC-type n=1 Tax=Tanacetum coccineum TaxID=301880 RepID=A0ABQ5CZB8_9ASTR